MLRIDASVEDTGGHAVRTALVLAALTRKEVEIVNIRSSRRFPGLRNEHLPVVRAINKVTQGTLSGDSVGSQTVHFRPGIPMSGSYAFSAADATGSSGSACHVLEAVVPILMTSAGKSEVVVRGGTHVPGAPTATYQSTVFSPTIRKFGAKLDLTIPKWGWAPHGIGELRAQIEYVPGFKGTNLTERGGLLQVGGAAIVTGTDMAGAERQRDRVMRRCSEVGKDATIQVKTVAADGTGGMTFLLAVFERGVGGFTAFEDGEKNAEQVADDAVNEMFEYLAAYATLDKHMADQVLIYAGLSDGETVFSTSENTKYLRSNALLLEQFLPVKVRIDGKPGQPADVKVYGSSGSRQTNVPDFFFG